MLKRTIYFDGECQLCSREIEMFQRRVHDGSLNYVDISQPTFDENAHGVEESKVQHHMHVRNHETDQLLIGVDALIGMWEVVPGFRWLATITRFPLVKPFARLGYVFFAWIRPKLPKRKRDHCETGCSKR